MIETALVWAARVLLTIFVGLNLLLAARKVFRDRRLQRATEIRTRWESRILSFAHSDERTFAVPWDATALDRRVIDEVVLDFLTCVDGIERERLGVIREEVGAIDRDLRETRHRNPWRRAHAVERLGWSGATRARDAIRRTLYDDSSEVRVQAIEALGRLGGDESLRTLVPLLERPDRWSALRVADAIRLRGQAAETEIVRAFPRLGVPARSTALDVIAELAPYARREWIEDRLADPSPEVRARAASALGELGDPRSGSVLLASLDDERPEVRAVAARALGRVRFFEAVSPLCRALRDDDWRVRSNAGGALAAMGEAGSSALTLMVDDDDPFAADQALYRLEEAGYVETEVRALCAEEERRRRLARNFFERIVRGGRVDRVRELAKSHPERSVREELHKILESAA